MASCGGGSQPLASGGPGPRPPGTTTWLRGARCTDPKGKCPPLHGGGRRRGRKRGPEAQNRRGGAPRGERPALWDARRLARRLACRVMCTPHGCRCTRTFLGAPPTPRFGVSEAKEITPRAKARRKRKGIVQDEVTPNGVMRGTLSSLVMRGQKRGGDARKRAYAPRIHLLRKTSLRRRMDCIATRACPSCAVLCAASRASPTCGVKPGNDNVGGYAHSFILPRFTHLRAARNATNRCAKWPPGQFHCFGVVLYNENCNSNVSGRRGPICHPDVSPSVAIPICHHPSS